MENEPNKNYISNNEPITDPK